MYSSFRVIVNGKEFEDFKSSSLSESLDSLSGSFAFVVARKDSNSGFNINDKVKIYINEYLRLTGKVNKIEANYDSSNHEYLISGYSDTFDIIKGTIFKNPNYSTPLTFLSLAKKVLGDNELSSVGINSGFASSTNISTIINDKEAGTSGDIGESVFAFLDRYARKVGVILSSDKDGKLVIYKNQPVPTGIRLKNIVGSNKNELIKSANYSVDYSNRIKKVIVISQSEFEDDLRGEATDSAVKADGVKCIISENVSDVSQLVTQAKWEINKRISDSVLYNCGVYGFAFEDEPWNINTLIDVEDEFAGVKSSMLIREVEFRFDEISGSTTSMTMVLPNSFSEDTSNKNPSNSAKGQ